MDHQQPGDILRTYERLAAQISWLLDQPGVDDSVIARAVIAAMRGEPVREPLANASERAVIGRLALLWLWRGPSLAFELVLSGPARLEQLAAGEGTMAEALSTMRALEFAPDSPAADPAPQAPLGLSRASDAAAAELAGALRLRLRALLDVTAIDIADLWALDDWQVQQSLDAIRDRLASDEGREVLDAVADDVARRVTEIVVAERGPLSSAQEHIARARRHVGGAAHDAARTRLSPEKLALALADADAALSLEPDSVEALLLRAHVDIINGQGFDRARADIARALELDPDDGHAYAVLSLAAQLEGDAAAVMEACARALGARRPDPAAYIYRGVARVETGDLDGAEEDAVAATTQLPRAPGGHWIAGRVRFLRGDHRGALEAYEIALAIDPNHAASYASRADVLLAQGDVQRALADLDRAVALSGASTMYYNRGNARLAAEDLEGAEADFSATLERDSRDFQACLNRGTVYLLRQDRERGLADFRRAAELAPAYAPARTKLGVLLLELGRSDEALVELRAALACAPTDWALRAEIEGIVASLG